MGSGLAHARHGSGVFRARRTDRYGDLSQPRAPRLGGRDAEGAHTAGKTRRGGEAEAGGRELTRALPADTPPLRRQRFSELMVRKRTGSVLTSTSMKPMRLSTVSSARLACTSGAWSSTMSI